MAVHKLKANVYTSPAVPFFNEETVLASVPSFINSIFNNEKYSIFPGFCDVHVHFREPGFSYKETIGTGSLSAAHGGYTAVCTMPNLNPVPDSVENLQQQLDLIRLNSVISVYPYGSITVGEKGQQLADLEGMASNVISFSDDGRGVQDEGMMREAMLRAKSLGKIITAHCEVNELLHGGYIHDGRYAAAHGHKGICSESEWRQIERDVRLAAETDCAYHVCHISCKESVDIIRDAKASGVNVTCETGPHYLVLCEDDLQEQGRFRMNPPLRSAKDRDALLVGIQDGTIDMIATDHAPHSEEEKSRGLSGSAFGVVGLETAFPVLYTKLIRPGIISMDRLMELLVTSPRSRFGIPFGSDFSVWDIESRAPVNPEDFVSKGKATPFEGMPLYGKCMRTYKDGKIVW